MKPDLREHSDPGASLYLLGVLAGDDRVAFEAHLLTCAACQAECDRLGPIVSGLADLGDDELAGYLAEADAAAAAVAVQAVPVAVAAQVAVPAEAGLAVELAGGSAARVHPVRAGRPRPGRGRGWSRQQVAVLALAVVAALGLGAAMGFVSGQSEAPAPSGVSLVAVADSAVSPASVSVFVISREHGVTIHATVMKLEPGVRYRLLAVTADGQTNVVAEWWGAVAAQDVTGDLAVSADALAFFSVVRLDGTPVMRATVHH